MLESIELKNWKKWRQPLSWLVMEDSNSAPVYKVPATTKLVLWAEIEPQTVIPNQPQESKKKI